MASERWTHRHVDFGLVDAKGRKIGAQVSIGRDASGFVGRVWATRDGEVFGAIRKSFTRPNLDALAAEAAKRVDAMAKRYAKTVAGHRHSGRDKLSGAHITIEVSEDREAGMYMVICDDHSTCVGVDTLRDARRTSTLDFCDECRDRKDGLAGPESEDTP